MSGENDNRVTWKGYKKLHLLIAKSIDKNYDTKTATDTAQKDWVADINRHNRGGKSMNHEQFSDSLFELVGVWCEGCREMLLYVEFLRTIFMNVVVVLHDTGTGTKKALSGRAQVLSDRAVLSARAGAAAGAGANADGDTDADADDGAGAAPAVVTTPRFAPKKVIDVKCKGNELEAKRATMKEHAALDEALDDEERDNNLQIRDVGTLEAGFEEEAEIDMEDWPDSTSEEDDAGEGEGQESTDGWGAFKAVFNVIMFKKQAAAAGDDHELAPGEQMSQTDLMPHYVPLIGATQAIW